MIILAAALIMIPADAVPVYSLEPAGIDFYYLPEFLSPLVEGVLTDETGALAGQPNSFGITFGCYYWKMETPITEKNLWIEEKLSSVIPPDLMEGIYTGESTWVEGSMAAEIPSSRSLGLMSQINFTFTSHNGVMGRGRAYGIFRNDYSVLLVIFGPSEQNPQNLLEQVVGMAVLSD